jgi:hypothetical protein
MTGCRYRQSSMRSLDSNWISQAKNASLVLITCSHAICPSNLKALLPNGFLRQPSFPVYFSEFFLAARPTQCQSRGLLTPQHQVPLDNFVCILSLNAEFFANQAFSHARIMRPDADIFCNSKMFVPRDIYLKQSSFDLSVFMLFREI